MSTFYRYTGSFALMLVMSAVAPSVAQTSVAPAPAKPAAVDEAAWVRALCQKVAREQRCVLLLDGLPTGLPTLSSDDEARITSQKGDARAAASLLADALDCDVSVSGRVFYLTHRYRTGNTLPGVTLPECAAFLRDMEGILRQFLGSKNRDMEAESSRQYTDALVRSFSESQWRAMKDRKLSISELDPEQQQMMSNYGVFSYINSYHQTVSNLQKRIGEISAPDAVFTSRQMGGRKVYGIDFSSGKSRLFLPLTAPDSFRLEGDGGMWSRQLDPSSDSESGSKQVGDAVPAVSETLAEVIERSNQRLLQSGPASPGEKAVSVRVDDALGEKPLEVFGAEGMSPAALAESTSRLYNLRLTRVTGEKLLLTRRPRIGVGVRDIASFAPAVRQVTPAPLVRYIDGHILEQARQEAQVRRNSGTKEELPPLPLPVSAIGITGLPDDLRKSAAKMLFAYAATLDRDNALASKPVPVSSLSAQARSTIANSVIAEMMADLPKYVSEQPAYISNLKDGAVRVEIQDFDSKGTRLYTLSLEVPLPGNTAATKRKVSMSILGFVNPGSAK